MRMNNNHKNTATTQISAKENEEWYKDLISWIQSNGGVIHPGISMKATSPNSRGIFATEDVAEKQTIIKLPYDLALSGENYPSKYRRNDEGEELQASPWLRCVAAIFSTMLQSQPVGTKKRKLSNTGDTLPVPTKSSIDHPYIASLPSTYDTLLHQSSWSDDNVKTFLGGTTIGEMVIQDRQSNTLQSRFKTTVRPYLEYCGVLQDTSLSDTSLYERFENVAACISTRGFHLKMTNDDGTPAVRTYSGPYILPFIDLLNHSSFPTDKCTTLQIISNQVEPMNQNAIGRFFLMKAERSVRKGEEILHSYGTLSSGQSLQTFGFVEINRATKVQELYAQQYQTKNALMTDSRASIDTSLGSMSDVSLTPAILSKSMVIKACYSTASSTHVQNLKSNIREKNELLRKQSEDDDIIDLWDIPTKIDLQSKETVLQSLPDELVVEQTGDLSDELITLAACCLLPDDVFGAFMSEMNDVESNTEILFSKAVLDDYYLGSLILSSIVCAIDSKMELYTKIDSLTKATVSSKTSSVYDGKIDGHERFKSSMAKLTDDELLKLLLSEKKDVGNNMKATYGITIRLEEKICLNKLKASCTTQLDCLSEELSMAG